MTGVGGRALELMQLHVAALYLHDARSRIRFTNEWKARAAPRFFLGRTIAGNLWRFRDDVPDDLAAELESLCNGEPVLTDLPPEPLHQEKYVRLLAPVERIWTGPAYAFAGAVAPGDRSVAITRENADLLRGGLEDWLEDVPRVQPFHAVLEQGRAVSVCASVRISTAAHEAGVETLPDHRRRGHAVSAVAGWAEAVSRIGAVPLYSTSWDNAASRGVAARLGLSMFGVDFHVT